MVTTSVVPSDTASIGASAPVQPRWEWRAFEPFPGKFIDTVGPRPAGQPSLEIYILSAESPHNVKIRAGQLDVKLLEGVGSDGLELWRPVFKQSFPIASHHLGPIWNAWGLAAAPHERPAYTLDEFLLEVVARQPRSLRAVSVLKTRSRLAAFECQAERALLTVAGERWETVALEDIDPARIQAAKQSLGAELPSGSNYPAWLKQVVGVPSTLSTRASI